MQLTYGNQFIHVHDTDSYCHPPTNSMPISAMAQREAQSYDGL